MKRLLHIGHVAHFIEWAEKITHRLPFYDSDDAETNKVNVLDNHARSEQTY